MNGAANNAARNETLAALLGRGHVVVCCGTGGVGKTTTAAALAIAAARAGRRCIVITIDPAKRLADTLALGTHGDGPHEIPRGRWDRRGEAPAGGRLYALVLDARSTFDALVRTEATGPEQAERILANRFYRNVAGALSGTQEYMAAEKLYELHAAGGYDLIVVDTPPTRHALDFLDAPARLTRLLDNRVFRLLMTPQRSPLRVASVADRSFLRIVGRVVGSEVVADITAFFRAFEGMEPGFRSRATEVSELLRAPDSMFVLVTSPRETALTQAELFAAQLRTRNLRVAALVVNRVQPEFGLHDPVTLDQRARQLSTPPGSESPTDDGAAARDRLAVRYRHLAEVAIEGREQRRRLDPVVTAIDATTTVYVPALPHDIVDFAALDAVTRHLLG